MVLCAPYQNRTAVQRNRSAGQRVLVRLEMPFESVLFEVENYRPVSGRRRLPSRGISVNDSD